MDTADKSRRLGTAIDEVINSLTSLNRELCRGGARLETDDWSGPPVGYTRLPDALRCRCPNLYVVAGAYYCCNGVASKIDGDPDHFEAWGRWEHEGASVSMWRHAVSGGIVYDDHPHAKRYALPIAAWRVGEGSDDRQMSLFHPTPAPIAHETENGASRPPAGYTELPAGKQCKCASLWHLDGAFYCCNGTAAPKLDQESNYVMQGTWAPHEGIQVRMWKHLDTGIVVYDDHPVARERKLRIAPWRVGLCDDRAAE